MFDNERVRFYLKHRDQLEEWFTLRPEVATAMDDWLSTLSTDLESLAVDLGSDVGIIQAVDDRSYPALFLKRSSWPGATDTDAPALIGLGWVRGKTLLDASAPYVGVRADRTTPIGRILRGDTQFQDRRRQRKDTSTQWWPAIVNVRPSEGFPETSAEYRRTLVETLRECWNVYSPVIDRAFSTSASVV